MKILDLERNEFASISDKIFFWTSTINSWYNLLEPDENKQLVVDSLKYLSDGKYITVYAFVIMPNHVHLIWKQNKLNGKETPKGSFLKYTGHKFLDYLIKVGKSQSYTVDLSNKNHEIWQNNSLAIEIFSLEMAKQKLDYIHFNPLSGKWNLAKDELSYFYSSARFYETGIDEFGFLENIFSAITGN